MRIGFGLSLITVLSAVLLFADWSRRRVVRRRPRVALLQFSRVGEKGVAWNRAKPGAAPGAMASSARPGKKWKIYLIELVNAPAIEDSRNGVLSGLKEAGLVEGRD